jgi:tetratricopeptide (TPR) repeat protein
MSAPGMDVHDTRRLWREADAILDRLLDLDVDERDAALERMGLVPELRRAVAHLLAAHSARGGVLDRALGDDRGPGPTATLRGRELGRWKLEEEIGRGGMAVVYRARATDGSGQVAALKLLTLGALASDGVARFRHEQAALARLRHVHIATLLDAGVAEDGTPWLAMVLVDGERIDAWCDARRLSPRQRVELFLDVCDAVACAHANLIIHRDLKPSNVLVDRDGEVRLLDFGIARFADDAAEMTATRWRALTPEYAAPEQLAGAPPSTAMDVHGLGALLYRLLSGRPPHATPRDPAAPITPPSGATGHAPDSAPSPLAAAERRQVRGDLDAIVMQALADDPAARYPTVVAFADDLRRWLAGLPVGAVRPSLAYRAGKWARRHRLVAGAAALLLLAIIAGSLATLWQARRAGAQAELAAQHAARATAVRDFLVTLFESADPEQAAGSIDTREIVAIGARRAREELQTEPALRVEMLRILGSIQRRLGDYDSAATTLDAAQQAADAASTAVSAGEIALLEHEAGVLKSIGGDAAAARALFERALQRLQAVPDGGPATLRADLLGELALVAAEAADFERAFALLDQADAVVATLQPPNPHQQAVVDSMRVNFLNTQGRFDEAAELSAQIVARARDAGLDRRGSFAQMLINAAKIAASAGAPERAIAFAEEGAQVAQQRFPARHPIVADALMALGNAHRQAGRHEAALPPLRDALARYDALALPDKQGEAAMLLGRSLLETAQPAPALVLAERYLPIIDASGERLSVAAFGLIDVALRAARERDSARYAHHADDAIGRLDALPEALRLHPQTQRVRRRLAQWRLDDGDATTALRLARQGDDAAATPGADLLMLHAVAIRATWPRDPRDAVAQFDRLAAALSDATMPPSIEAETRLAIAQAAVEIDHPQAQARLLDAEQAHARSPLPPLLAAKLTALRTPDR